MRPFEADVLPLQNDKEELSWRSKYRERDIFRSYAVLSTMTNIFKLRRRCKFGMFEMIDFKIRVNLILKRPKLRTLQECVTMPFY